MRSENTNQPDIKEYAASSIRYRLTSDFITVIIRIVEKLINLVLPRQLIFENEKFVWIKEIEKKYPQILDEFNRFSSETGKLPDLGKISEEELRLVKLNQWKFIPLYIYGNKINFICDKLPFTTQAVEGIPDLSTAFISLLSPHAKISEHRGTFRGYLRYHLGLQIPEPYTSCGLQLEEELIQWQNGKSIVFDDTYLHCAWNNSNELRAVLWVDFIRPLPYPLRKASMFVTKLISASPYVQNILAGLMKYKFDPEMTGIFK